MKSRDFCFWLQGFIELNQKGEGGVSYAPNEQQWGKERPHLGGMDEHGNLIRC